MQDLFDSVALNGLRYLDILRHQPVRPSVEAFQGYLDQPRPERKSLTEAVKASKGPTGADILAWMLAVGWVALTEFESGERVDITELGSAILSIAPGDSEPSDQARAVASQDVDQPSSTSPPADSETGNGTAGDDASPEAESAGSESDEATESDWEHSPVG
jgi:hypothetical protein